MANYDMVNKDITDVSSPASMVPYGEKNAPVKVMIDTYTTAAIASGSTITSQVFPAGAVLVDLIVQCTALGSSTTLAAGDGTTADLYIAAASSAAATALRATKGLNTSVAGESIVLTTGGATLDAAGTITIIAFYVTK